MPMQIVGTKLSWALLPTSSWLNLQTAPTNVAVRIATASPSTSCG